MFIGYQGQIQAIADNYLQLEGGYTEYDVLRLDPQLLQPLIEGKHPYLTNMGVMWQTFKSLYKGKDKSFNYFQNKLNKDDVIQIAYEIFKPFENLPAPLPLILWWSAWGTGNAIAEIKELQRLLNVPVDGNLGPKTFVAAWLNPNKQKVASQLIAYRKSFLTGGLPGWMKGIDFLQSFSDKYFKKKEFLYWYY